MEALRNPAILLAVNTQVHWNKQYLGKEQSVGTYQIRLLLLSMEFVYLFCPYRLFTVHCLGQSVLSLS